MHTITKIDHNPVCNGVLNGWCFGVIPESVGQYTGLKDKNGVEVYHKDIVTNGVSTYVVAGSAWKIQRGDVLHHHIDLELMGVEVIGNIHQNEVI